MTEAHTPTPWPEPEYDNDTGPSDEGFWEWWSIPGVAKFYHEEEALIARLAVNSHARLQRVADAARALDTAEDFSEPIGPGQDPQDWDAYNALRRELGEALADLLTLKSKD